MRYVWSAAARTAGVLFFSVAGELLFTVEARNLQGAISRGDRLYLVTKAEAERELRLAAFEIG
jgi:hypothetical protein